MDKKRRGRCANCGRGFKPDPRVGARQHYCGASTCRLTRRRVAQAARRRAAKAGGVKPSPVTRQERAKYMQGYRERRPEYREGEATRARRRRIQRRNEASLEAARFYSAKAYVELGAEWDVAGRLVVGAGIPVTVSTCGDGVVMKPRDRTQTAPAQPFARDYEHRNEAQMDPGSDGG